MGVLQCNRKDCENIMCDRLSNHYGYICNECFEELCSKGVKQDIQEFMDSKKKVNNERATRIYYGSIFPIF